MIERGRLASEVERKRRSVRMPVQSKLAAQIAQESKKADRRLSTLAKKPSAKLKAMDEKRYVLQLGKNEKLAYIAQAMNKYKVSREVAKGMLKDAMSLMTSK